MADSKFAVPELAAVEVHGMTREAFIVRGALGAGAVYGVAAVGPYLSNAFAQTGGGDVAILNYALTLEYLEANYYTKQSKKAGLSGAAKTLASLIAGHETAHVDALTKAIQGAGGTPAALPKFAFPSSTKSEQGFLALASVLETTGVSAYNGQGPNLQNKAYLAAAGSIVQIEARHSAAINNMIGKSPTPSGAFDKPLEMPAVLKAVKPLIKA
ncbi:MAG: ferritin-like domain-containing protein [Solirubrobacteraceae bacterium]